MGSLRHPGDGEESTPEQILETLTPAGQRQYEKLDDLEVIGDRRRRGRSAVSINGVMGRVVIYSSAYEALCKGAKRKKVTHVLLKMSPRYPRVFWICPCLAGDTGARGIIVSGKTMLLSAKALVSHLGLRDQATARYDARWDPVNEGLVVDTSVSI